MTKKSKDGYILKSDVQLIIQNYIRNIQMNDSSSDNSIPQLYAVMRQIEKMPVKEFNEAVDESNNSEINNSCPVSNDCSSKGCYRYYCCEFKREK